MSPNPTLQLWCMAQLSLQRNQISLQRFVMSLHIVFTLNLINAKRIFFLIAMLEFVNLKYNSTCIFFFYFLFTSSSNHYNIYVPLQCTSLYIVLQPLLDTNIG